MDQTTATALANEARKTALKVAIADLQGRVNSGASTIGIISSQLNDAQRALQQKQTEQVALEAGAGPGITDDFGLKADHLAAFIEAAAAAGLITDVAAARTLGGL